MNSNGIRMVELRWLAQQKHPVWGGHLERGEPITNAVMQQWVDDGIIKPTESPSLGYVITEKGRALVAAHFK